MRVVYAGSTKISKTKPLSKTDFVRVCVCVFQSSQKVKNKKGLMVCCQPGEVLDVSLCVATGSKREGAKKKV